MRKNLFLIMMFLWCAVILMATPDTEYSTKDYLEYVNSFQQVSEQNQPNGIPMLFRNMFKFDKLEDQIRIMFSPEKINKGELQREVRKSQHASLIVFFVALGGLIVLLYGYKLLPLLIMIFGAYLGSVATYNVIERFFTVGETELILFVIMGTVIMAIASLLLRNMFIFLFGAAFGAFVSQVILNLFTFEITNTLLFMLFVAIMFAVFVLLFKRFFMIVLTALSGSIMLVFSVQYLVLEMFRTVSHTDEFFIYTSIIIFLIMLILGVFFQFKTTKRSKES